MTTPNSTNLTVPQMESSETISKCSKTGAIEKIIQKKQKKCEAAQRKRRELKCNFLSCSQTFTNRFNLRRHIMLVHTQIRPFQCALCSKRFGLLQYYREHMLSHFSFEKVDEMLKDLDSSVLDSLPIFRVEDTDSSTLIPNMVASKPLPPFVEFGRLPTPKFWNHPNFF